MTQKYTRWRDTDDDEEAVNGPVESLEEDEDDIETRRAFTLMTPQRDEPPKKLMTLKLLLIMAIMCLISIVLGGSIGYLAASVAPIPKPASSVVISTTTTTTTPRTTTTTTAPPQSREDVMSMSLKLLSQLQPHHIEKFQTELAGNHGDRVGRYIKATLKKMGYNTRQLTYTVTTSYTENNENSLVELMFVNGTSKTVFSTDTFRTLTNGTFSPFNGYSGNGTFNGTLVYGHFATEDDLQIVQASKIRLNNTVLLVRRGDIHPGVQVRNAEKYGVKAVIFYADPADWGQDNKTYPNGSRIPMDAVVSTNLRYLPGDPATNGYASIHNVYKELKFEGVPSIPVQSVSAEVAKDLLKLLGGPSSPENWKGNLSEIYFLGGNFELSSNVSSVKVSVFSNLGNATVNSYHAQLPSKDQSKVIHVGVHYDSTSMLMQGSSISIAAWLAFASALKVAFPSGTERQIVFHAFPGTNGDYSGGTEFVELYSNWINMNSLAYIDFNEILQGGGFFGSKVSPILRDVANKAMKHVDWPEKEGINAKIGLLQASEKSKNIPGFVKFDMEEPSMCGESVSFFGRGIPTLTFYARDMTKSNYSLANTQYDNIKAITKLLDPKLKWTHTAASLMSISTLLLANSRFPVSFELFAHTLLDDWDTFRRKHKNSMTHSDYDFEGLANSISGEFDVLVNHLDNMDLWYRNDSYIMNYATFRNQEDKLNKILYISRHFLRPRNIPNVTLLGSLMTYGPDVKNPCKGVEYPMATQIIDNILLGKNTWKDLHKELSILLSSISSLNADLVKPSNYY